MNLWLISLAAGALLILTWLFVKADKRKLLRRTLGNLAAGLLLLTVLNALSGVTAIALPLNLLSLGTGAILGAPGMLSLFAVKMFF